MAQTFKTSIVVDGNVNATGFYGDGSNLTGITPTGALLLTGGDMTGSLTITAGGIPLTLTSSQNTGLVVDGGTNSGVIADFKFGTRKAYISTSGNIYVSGLFDIDDTNYYVNPAGTSNFSTVNAVNTYVGNAIYFGGANNYLNWDGSRINSNVGIQSGVDMRAPIFYDSIDPNYYVDPSGTSNLNELNVGGQAVITAGNISSQSVSYAASSGQTGFLSTLGAYVWNASTNGRSFAAGIQTSFVRSEIDGYPSYGSVVRIKTYTEAQDGGTAELYFPYASGFGGSSMQYRLGQYNNAGWTGWKTVIDSDSIGSQSVSYATSAGNASTTSQKVFTDLKIEFPSGGSGGYNFGSNHYSMGLDVGDGAWSHPHYKDLIIGYHTGIRLGALYSGIRFYNNSPTTDANNDGNGDGGEALLMTVGGYVGTANHTDVVVNNNLFANVSMRSPIFYDSNDTGYYVDAASTSNLNSLNVGGQAVITAGNIGSQSVNYAASAGAVYGNQNGSFGLNDTKLYLRTNGDNNHYLWNAADDWEELNAYEGTGLRITSVGGSTGILYVYGSSNGGYTYSPYSFRSPIFYDSNDTGYYVDPASTSNLNILTLSGNGYFRPNSWIQFDGNYGIFSATVNNAHFRPNHSTYGSWEVLGSRNGWQGLEFNSGTNGSITQMISTDSNTVGFHNNTHGWQIRWANGTMYVGKNSYGGSEATVLDTSNAPRANYGNLMYYQGFTLDANTMDTNSTGFTYAVNAPYVGPIVRFSTGGGYDLWLNSPYGGNGYGLAFRTRNGDNASLNSWQYPAVYGVNANGGGSLYSTIYYDQDNTGYYVDPASTSNLAGLTVANTITGSISGSAGSVAWGNVSSKPAGWLSATTLSQGNEPNTNVPSGFYESYLGAGNPTGTWFSYINVRHTNPGNGHGYQLGMSFYDNNLWFRSYQGGIPSTYQSWEHAIGSGGSHQTKSGILQSDASLRAPIFYDSNDTTYYTDPASTSYINGLNVGGQTWRGDITWNSGVNIYVSGESSFDILSSGGAWQVWTAHTSQPSIYVSYCGRTEIGQAGNRGLYVYGDLENTGCGIFTNGLGTSVARLQSYEVNGDYYGSYWRFGAFGITANVSTGENFVYDTCNGALYIGGTIYQNYYSDCKYKENITVIESALDKIDGIRGVEFDWNALGSEEIFKEGHEVGVIAQEVQAVYPQAVREVHKEREDKVVSALVVDQEKLIPLLLQGVKELKAIATDQQREIDNLKNIINGSNI